jgi:dTDP-4-dehydrorhamnose reductase
MAHDNHPVCVLLFGENGMLGHDLRSVAPGHFVVHSSGDAVSYRLDITNRGSVIAALDSIRPHWAVNAAGYTKVDQAETETDRAVEVNATAVATLGEECARRGIRVVHFSTDYVFPGTGQRPYREDDPTSPINAYGASKLRGEQGLIESGARALIVRTQWLFGRAGRSFPRTMWERATAGLRTRVVDDQVGRPTYTRDLAAWTWQLMEQNADGIVHAANAGPATWFEVAARVFERVGVEHLLTPCRTADYPTPAGRPRYSVLETTKLERAIGPVRRWQEALDEFLSELADETGDDPLRNVSPT